MPTNFGTVLLLLIITLCAVLYKSIKKYQRRYTSFQHLFNSKVTIFTDSNYVVQ